MTRNGTVSTSPATRVLHALRFASLVVLTSVWVVALPASAIAQNSSISGVVTDPQQAVVQGAEVTLRNSRSVATPTTVTDASGRYAFTGLPVGTYVVQVYVSGF